MFKQPENNMNDYHSPSGLGGFRMFPPVLKSLIIINIVIFILQALFLDGLRLNGVSLERYIMNYFALMPIESGGFYIWQLLSYQFLHGGFTHLLFNLLALWMFGSELENRWGSVYFLIFYLLSGIGAGIAQLFVSPMLGAVAPTIGASGSIFGILLAFGATFPDRKIYMFPLFIPIPAKIFVAIYASFDLISGLMGASTGVAHFAHLGGAVAGAILLLISNKIGLFKFSKKLNEKFESNTDFYKRSRYVNPQEVYRNANKTVHFSSFIVDNELVTQETIDGLLDKISESGYQSLTDREKRILYELSQRMN